MPVRLAQPADVELVIGPADEDLQVREGDTYSQSYTANEWQRAERGLSCGPTSICCARSGGRGCRCGCA